MDRSNVEEVIFADFLYWFDFLLYEAVFEVSLLLACQDGDEPFILIHDFSFLDNSCYDDFLHDFLLFLFFTLFQLFARLFLCDLYFRSLFEDNDSLLFLYDLDLFLFWTKVTILFEIVFFTLSFNFFLVYFLCLRLNIFGLRFRLLLLRIFNWVDSFGLISLLDIFLFLLRFLLILLIFLACSLFTFFNKFLEQVSISHWLLLIIDIVWIALLLCRLIFRRIWVFPRLTSFNILFAVLIVIVVGFLIKGLLIFFIIVVSFAAISVIALLISLFAPDITPDLDPFDFTFVNGWIEIHNFYFAIKSLTFYPASRTFSSLIANENAFMNNSLLFLFWLFVRLTFLH